MVEACTKYFPSSGLDCLTEIMCASVYGPGIEAKVFRTWNTSGSQTMRDLLKVKRREITWCLVSMATTRESNCGQCSVNREGEGTR